MEKTAVGIYDKIFTGMTDIFDSSLEWMKPTLWPRRRQMVSHSLAASGCVGSRCKTVVGSFMYLWFNHNNIPFANVKPIHSPIPMEGIGDNTLKESVTKKVMPRHRSRSRDKGPRANCGLENVVASLIPELWQPPGQSSSALPTFAHTAMSTKRMEAAAKISSGR